MYWEFIQNQILGMKWLNVILGRCFEYFGLDINSRFGGSVLFFVYDVIKITILLCVLIFVVSFIQTYFPPERSKRIMGRFKGIKANIIGAFLGALTPFCSCSSIPIFMGFTSAGLPLGMTFSFLISSPMINPGSLVLLMSVFGSKIAFAYVIFGLTLAVTGGTFIESLHMEKYIEEFAFTRKGVIDSDIEFLSFTTSQRIKYSRNEVIATFKVVFPYILAGVGIGALIHNWIPQEFIQIILGSNNPFGVIIATLVGIPIYADIFGTIPIAEALLAKGAVIGTILSFMMAVTDLSLPSMIMLRKVIKPRLLWTFIAVCAIGIVFTGYTFNALHYVLM
ncbi:MAG: permease [Synergistaceae bacterium]|nr:permease [Synergistaceae bacterium]